MPLSIGWVYGVAMIAVVEEGRLSLTFLRASNLVLAYKEFRGMIGNYSNTGEFFLFCGFCPPIELVALGVR